MNHSRDYELTTLSWQHHSRSSWCPFFVRFVIFKTIVNASTVYTCIARYQCTHRHTKSHSHACTYVGPWDLNPTTISLQRLEECPPGWGSFPIFSIQNKRQTSLKPGADFTANVCPKRGISPWSTSRVLNVFSICTSSVMWDLMPYISMDMRSVIWTFFYGIVFGIFDVFTWFHKISYWFWIKLYGCRGDSKTHVD